MNRSKIIMLCVMLISLILFTQTTTGKGKLSLYKILPERTFLVYEQLEKVPLAEKHEMDYFTKLLKALPASKDERFLSFLKEFDEKMKKVIGLECKLAFAMFSNEESESYLEVNPSGGIRGPGVNKNMFQTIKVPINYIYAITCQKNEKWDEYKKLIKWSTKKTIKFWRQMLKKWTNFPTFKFNIKEYSDNYMRITFSLSDPTNIVKFFLKQYTYIVDDSIVFGTSKQYIKKYLKQFEGTLLNSDSFKYVKEKLNTDNYKEFWWFNYELLYKNLKSIISNFIPPDALAPFLQVEAVLGLNKIATFNSFKDRNDIWKMRINFTQESDLISKLFSKSGYDKDFICSEVDTKNTSFFWVLNLTKEGALALLDKIQIVAGMMYGFDSLTEYEDINNFINVFNKYVNNNTFSGNLCTAVYSKVEANNRKSVRLAFYYKTSNFSNEICREFAGEGEEEECDEQNHQIYTIKHPDGSEESLEAWFDGERDGRLIFSKSKQLLLFFYVASRDIAPGNSDKLYKEVLEFTRGKEKNGFDTPLGFNINIKKFLDETGIKNGVSDVPLLAGLLEYVLTTLSETIYIKFSGGKDYLEVEIGSKGK